jgi:hypothetical protein
MISITIFKITKEILMQYTHHLEPLLSGPKYSWTLLSKQNH